MDKIFVALLCFLYCLWGLDNGLGRTPPMGWNSWNKFGCNINETVIRNTVDQLIKTGLRDKGYKYVNLDDCWQISRNPTTHQIQYDKTKFPSGFQELIDYVHENGFLFGLYSDAGTKTCQGRPGGLQHEKIDAQTYAKWGVDYLKYDNCYNEGVPVKLRYTVMRDALNQTGRPIYFSMCEWGYEKPWEWAENISNSWRTTMDIKDVWISFIYNLQRQVGLSKYAKPGAWNDPDMLEVGNGGMTHDQYQSHFALWALLKSPLLIGCDLNNMSTQTLEILSNQQIIAVNQDELGEQGDLIEKTIHLDGYKEVWGGKLSKNRFAIVFFNHSPASTKFSFDFSQYNKTKGKTLTAVRDIVRHEDKQVPKNGVLVSQQIRKHACKMYVISFGETRIAKEE